MPVDDKAVATVNLVVQRFEVAHRHREPQLRDYRATINAYLNKGPVFDPFAISVKTGRLMKDLETITPRDVRALLGSTPYFPYEAVHDEFRAQAQAVEDIVDYFTTHQTPSGDFYTAFTDALHVCRPFGKSYLWPHWDYWPESIYTREPEVDPMTGEIVGMNENRDVDIQQAMVYGFLHPWQVFVAPFGETLNQKPWIIIQLRVHKSELLPRLDRKMYKLIRDGQKITWKELSKDTGSVNDRQNSETYLSRDAGGELPEFSEDVGTLLMYIQNPTKEYPKGREIHVWDYRTLLYDEDRSDWNLPLFVKPVIDLNHIVHIGPDKFHGIGLWSIIRDRVLVSEEATSIFIDHVLRTSTGTMMYNSDILKESQILPVIGGRIPVPGGRFDEATRIMDLGDANPKLMDISDRMERSIDDSDGINDFISGSPLDRKELATTVTTQSNASQVRVEHYASYLERTALYRIGTMTPKIIDRHITDYDKAKILGPERAAMLASVDPAQIPGGYRIRFAGSDRVRNKERQFEKSERTFNMLGQLVGPYGIEQISKSLLEWGMDKLPPEARDQIAAEIGQKMAQMMGAPQPGSMSSDGITMNPPSQTPLNSAAAGAFAAQAA